MGHFFQNLKDSIVTVLSELRRELLISSGLFGAGYAISYSREEFAQLRILLGLCGTITMVLILVAICIEMVTNGSEPEDD